MDRNFADLPDSVDVVIFGTDVTQSILAAACARNGLTVLHLDRNDYYGDKSCVFTLAAAEEFIASACGTHCNGAVPISDDQAIVVDDSEEIIYLPTVNVENFEFVRRDFPCCQQSPPDVAASSNEASESAFVSPGQNSESISQPTTGEITGNHPSPSEGQNECVSPPESTMAVTPAPSWTKETLIAASRRFNIDMTPNLVYSTGKTVELLVNSDVARYVEFKNIGKLFVFTGEAFENVPCSRADVFSDTRLTLIEKRLLMRLFATALDYGNKPAEENVPLPCLFVDYLHQTCRLPDRLVYFVQHAITMASENCTTQEGLLRTRNFLKSCSIYGPTPFLWPLYGCAEFPQAFCRLAAVYGTVYILRSSPLAIIRDKTTKRCTAVIMENGKRIACKFFASSSSYCPPGLLSKLLQNESLSYGLALRAVLLSSKSFFPPDPAQQHPPLIFGRVPKESFTVSIIELPDHAMSCPSGAFLHQVTAHLRCLEKTVISVEDHTSDSQSFDKFLESLFSFDNSDGSDKPKVFWRFQFANSFITVNNKTAEEIEVNDFRMAENMFILPDALSNDSSLDFDMSVAIAKLVFKELKPDAEEFIPKMPQPPVSDDVAMGDEDFQAAELPQNEQAGNQNEPAQNEAVIESGPSPSSEPEMHDIPPTNQ